jgi:pyridoxine kinase
MNTRRQEKDGAVPAVIVISSHVVRGTVGNRAAAFALEVLGHGVWSVPSVVLPWHPGHGQATRIVPPKKQFAALLRDLSSAPWRREVGAVLSGYIGDASQAVAIGELVMALKNENPELLYACDPVIGDGNALYVEEQTAEAIKQHLLPIADLITPNRFELAWLTGNDPFDDNNQILAAARGLGRPMSLVTSAFSLLRNATGNILLHSGGAIMAEHTMVGVPPNGPGDLTAALFVAHCLAKLPVENALHKTTASVFEVLARAAKRKADELMLETDFSSLIRPMAMVQMRKLHIDG